MGHIYQTSYLGNKTTVYINRVEFSTIGAGTHSIPINQIASIKKGSPGFYQVIIETTGGKKYKIPTSQKNELSDAIYKVIDGTGLEEIKPIKTMNGNTLKLNNSTGKYIKIGLIVFGVLVVLGVIFGDSLESTNTTINSEVEAPLTDEKKLGAESKSRKDLISKHFSAWDGSHDGLTKVIKSSINDPKSYEHVETVYWDLDDHLIVSTTFRGKNAFGGVVTNSIKAKVSLDGEVLEIIEQN